MLSPVEAAHGRFEQLGLAAAVQAALDTGLLEVLLEGAPRSPGELAEELELRPAIVEPLLGLLASTDLVERGVDEAEGARATARATSRGPARYGAGPLLRALDEHGDAFVEMELDVWRRLPRLLRAGTDVAAPDRGPAYAAVVDDLARLAEPAAERLASALDAPGPRLLDVACGAGVWSLAVARAHPDVRVSGLDLPEVVPRFLEGARRAGVSARVEARAGDMHALDPEPGTWNTVILANVLRLEGPEGARRLLNRLAPAVAPGGALVVVDAFPGPGPRSRRLHAAYRLHLSLRCPGGGTLEPSTVEGWLREEGLDEVRRLDLGTEGPMGALVARRG